MLGDEAVLEHHCNYIPDTADWAARLAIENWDAPVVVTTNVQFFDSFYARKPTKCRKLHNVADSVVIFDEVQAIPVEKLKPCLEVIRELALNYKVTSVLCTATQPAIHYSEAFETGLQNVREIVRDVPALFSGLKRTKETFIGPLSENELAGKLAAQEQVLCIVNTRQQALDVFEALPASGANKHLSALMYPAHRSRMLAEIRSRLEAGMPCRVVSTQLIEAGVDVDFACVFRAVGGIDSIAQAAGRCNRNGCRDTPGPVYVFSFPEEAEKTYNRQAAQSAQKLFDAYDGDLTSPDCVRAYFRDYFWKHQQRMDDKGILDRCRQGQQGDIQFKDIAAFKMIETATKPVVVALEKTAVELVDQLAHIEFPAATLRRLQQYSVQIYPYQFDEIRSWLETPSPGVWVLRSAELYSQQTGLKCSPPEGCAFFG
jgi:CRISPR-associated endonuclease/helicase Cas3